MARGRAPDLGSEGGGKTSVDFAFLARAIKQGLTVFDQCEVESIARADDGYLVTVFNYHRGQR